VATTSSIVWEGCIPVFVDIHPDYLTIDESKIESAITKNTSAILATHVFGNPCDVKEIETIAKKHHLKVIYDAAHCFAVTYKGKSIFEYGDVSSCSFHATKLFHTGEGGAIFFNSDALYNTVYYHHNFGHKGNEDFQGLGINAKMSEPQAAMGLSVLPYMSDILKDRKRVVDTYLQHLPNLKTIKIRAQTQWNYSYLPVIFNSEEEVLEVMKGLKEEAIFPRRYFYPSLNTLPYVNDTKMPISEHIAKCVLCLPLYYGLIEADIIKICNLIKSSVC